MSCIMQFAHYSRQITVSEDSLRTVRGTLVWTLLFISLEELSRLSLPTPRQPWQPLCTGSTTFFFGTFHTKGILWGAVLCYWLLSLNTCQFIAKSEVFTWATRFPLWSIELGLFVRAGPADQCVYARLFPQQCLKIYCFCFTFACPMTRHPCWEKRNLLFSSFGTLDGLLC